METPHALPAPGADVGGELPIRVKIAQHSRRCLALGRPDDAEIARLVADFVARGGRIRQCAAAYALPTGNGAGRDAERWAA